VGQYYVETPIIYKTINKWVDKVLKNLIDI